MRRAHVNWPFMAPSFVNDEWCPTMECAEMDMITDMEEEFETQMLAIRSHRPVTPYIGEQHQVRDDDDATAEEDDEEDDDEDDEEDDEEDDGDDDAGSSSQGSSSKHGSGSHQNMSSGDVATAVIIPFLVVVVCVAGGLLYRKNKLTKDGSPERQNFIRDSSFFKLNSSDDSAMELDDAYGAEMSTFSKQDGSHDKYLSGEDGSDGLGYSQLGHGFNSNSHHQDAAVVIVESEAIPTSTCSTGMGIVTANPIQATEAN